MGRFQPTDSAEWCPDLCPAGKFSLAAMRNCVECPEGKFSPYAEQGLCYTCPAGFFSLSNREDCTECPSGKYQGDQESGTCNNCPSGYQSKSRPRLRGGQAQSSTGMGRSRVGILSCNQCPGGWFASSDETEDCTECPPG